MMPTIKLKDLECLEDSMNKIKEYLPESEQIRSFYVCIQKDRRFVKLATEFEQKHTDKN